MMKRKELMINMRDKSFLDKQQLNKHRKSVKERKEKLLDKQIQDKRDLIKELIGNYKRKRDN